MATSAIQIAANQENAQRSTGPRTPEGKQVSSRNATRHGLTGKAVLLPEEDRAAYEALCCEFARDLQPKGALEQHLVQTLADHQWRLQRAHAREFGAEQPAEIEQLTRHSSRILRDFTTTLKALQSLQGDRKAHEALEVSQAAHVQRLMDMKKIPWDPSEDGFVLSRAQVRAEVNRRNHCDESHLARTVGYDLQRFRAARS